MSKDLENTPTEENEFDFEELSKEDLAEMMKQHFKKTISEGGNIIVQDSYWTKNIRGEDVVMIKFFIEDINKKVIGGSLEGGKSVIILSKDGERWYSVGDISEEEQKKVSTKFDLPRGVISLVSQ